jgi:N-acetylglucosamine-6-phosphate deacetylase
MQIEFPSLFDLQVNGFGGVDFNNPATSGEDVLRAIDRMRRTGVSRFLATLITSPFERFAQCVQTLVRSHHAAIAGIHMEGPYIAADDGPRGAHPREHVTWAGIDDFARRQEAAGGNIRLVTLAPEVPGAMVLIEHLVSRGVRVAIGHTAATPEQIRDAIKAGATLSTHLGNACASQLARHPNLIWEQLAADELSASLIVDGHHLPAATVKAMMRAKTPQRTILITDATAAAGCAPGRYELNGETVVLSETGRVSQVGKPWLAGSALTLDQAVANMVKFADLPLEEVWTMASTIPAQYLGLRPAGKVAADWDPATCQLTDLKVLAF